MTDYSIFQCSVCRRQKDLIQDQVRALPNQCTITKGCQGYLFPIGETTIFTPTPPVANLTDWYPRGQKPTVIPAPIPEQTINLSTSTNGILTLAYYTSGSFANPPPSSIIAVFSQQLIQDVSYNEFTFNIAASTTIIAGKDSTGKNLRFSSNDVANGLVVILVNGVSSFAGTGWTSAVANQIAFTSTLNPGTVVSISVYAQAPIFTIPLTFTLNQATNLTTTISAWSNIRWLKEYDTTIGELKPNNWWLYSCAGTDVLVNSARLKLLGIYVTSPHSPLGAQLVPAGTVSFSDIRFLLAREPFDNADRYLNFYIDGNIISSEYSLLTKSIGSINLFADSTALSEMYPPYQLIENTSSSQLSSFIIPDTFVASDYASTPADALVGSKIIGPL